VVLEFHIHGDTRGPRPGLKHDVSEQHTATATYYPVVTLALPFANANARAGYYQFTPG
jgi:hypothetical protein